MKNHATFYLLLDVKDAIKTHGFLTKVMQLATLRNITDFGIRNLKSHLLQEIKAQTEEGTTFSESERSILEKFREALVSEEDKGIVAECLA